jgi:hypothetical protein
VVPDTVRLPVNTTLLPNIVSVIETLPVTFAIPVTVTLPELIVVTFAKPTMVVLPAASVPVIFAKPLIVVLPNMVLPVTLIEERLAPISNSAVPFDENIFLSVKFNASSAVSRKELLEVLVVFGVRPDTEVLLS